MSPADLETNNLLPRPSTILSSGPGVVYFLVFEKSIGPEASDPAITAWVEQGGQLLVLGLARNGDSVGVCVKIPGGAQRTVQNSLLTLGGAPSFGTADLTLRFAVQGSDPRKLPDVAAAGAQTTEINDGLVATVKRDLSSAGHALSSALPSVKNLGLWVVVVLLLVAAILVVPRLLPVRD